MFGIMKAKAFLSVFIKVSVVMALCLTDIRPVPGQRKPSVQKPPAIVWDTRPFKYSLMDNLPRSTTDIPTHLFWSLWVRRKDN